MSSNWVGRAFGLAVARIGYSLTAASSQGRDDQQDQRCVPPESGPLCVYREVQVLKKAAVAPFVNRGRGTRLSARESTEHTETERFLRRCARVRF